MNNENKKTELYDMAINSEDIAIDKSS